MNRSTQSTLKMKTEPKPITDAEFTALITRGAARLTPHDVHTLVSDLPDVREQFSRLRTAGFADAERLLHFLSQVVELVWTNQYRDMQYGAALEAAFAVSYFTREGDLIPDTLGAIGLIDDIAVAQTVMLRNAAAYQALSTATNLPWPLTSSTPGT